MLWPLLGARWLEPTLFGVMSVLVAWLLVLQLLCGCGMNQALVRFVPALANSGAATIPLRLRFTVIAIPALVAAAGWVVSMLWPGIRVPAVEAPLGWVVVGALGLAYAYIFAGYWKATRRPILGTLWGEVSIPLVFLGFVIWWSRMRGGTESLESALLFTLAAWGAISLVLLLLFARGTGPGTEVPTTKSLGFSITPIRRWSFGAKAMATGLVYLGITVIDRIMLGAWASLPEAGVYTLAARGASALAIAVYVLAPVTGPHYAAHLGSAPSEALRLYQRTSAWVHEAILPLGLLLLFHAREILVALGGEAYGEGATSLRVLTFGYLLVAGTGNNGLLLQMGGRENDELRLSGTALVLNVLLNLWAIPAYGMVGAAAATTFGLVTTTAFKVGLVKRVWGRWPVANFKPWLLLAALAWIAVELIARSSTSGASWIALALPPVAYVLVRLVPLRSGVGRSAWTVAGGPEGSS